MSNLNIPDFQDCGCYGLCKDCIEKSTRRDIQMAKETQYRQECETESELVFALEKKYEWNLLHAKEIAKLAWIQLYAEKEG